MTTRTPKQILEWLCEGHPAFWRRNAKGELSVNVYALAKALDEWAKTGEGREAVSQSTLHRLYTGESQHFSEETLETLSEFFGVPKAVIRGDVEWNSVEAWGMDITIAELRLIALMRKLTAEQRGVIYEMIRVMLPNEAPLIAPLAPPPNVTQFPIRKPNKR